MKLLIAGSRGIMLTLEQVKGLIPVEWQPLTEIVHGGCAGSPDMAGNLLGIDLEIPIRVYAVNWQMHGKAAGPIRNLEMARYADVGLFVWDGSSRGTKGGYDYMTDLRKPTRLIKIVKGLSDV